MKLIGAASLWLMWKPIWWDDKVKGIQAETMFDEFEFVANYAHWVEAPRNKAPVIITDIDAMRNEISDTEYYRYKKMNLQSVIGVPVFYQRPCGFVIAKNPKRHVHTPSMLSYVVLNSWKEQQNIDALHMQIKRQFTELKNEKDVYVRLFGTPEIHTLSGELSAKMLQSAKWWRLFAYLLLHRKPVPMKAIAEALCPNEDAERVENTLRVMMSRKKSDLQSIFNVSEPIIVSSEYGYSINPKYHIVTDFDEFKILTTQAINQKTIYRRISKLKKALDLYRGKLYAEASDEH